METSVTISFFFSLQRRCGVGYSDGRAEAVVVCLAIHSRELVKLTSASRVLAYALDSSST